MLKISSITSDPLQKQTINLPDGTFVTFTMYYIDQQIGWFIRELVYGSIKIQGLRICNGLNILGQFQNKLPFGLACLSSGKREPFLIKDFSSGNSALYILTADEVKKYSRFLSGG